MRAFIIVDLGYGDSGKGLLTDFLVREYGAGVVVRYNGGAQAGHNVVTPDGRHHTFSQFGAGTFVPGVRTFLSSHVVVHPAALLVEGGILEKKGIADAFSRINISDRALIITPFHQAANHIRELARGKNRHGSCGVGVGETYEDSIRYPAGCIRAGDLFDLAGLERKLESIRKRKQSELLETCGTNQSEPGIAREWEVFKNPDVIEMWMDSISRFTTLDLVKPDSALQDILKRVDAAVFEGAQGVLLDADAGFHPHTTWSNCTGRNAVDTIQMLAPGSTVLQLGVLRSHAIRHGNGPLPTETHDLDALIREHNRQNEWQGNVRYGWFDAVTARYALEAAGKMDALAITHMDALAGRGNWTYCNAYLNAPYMDQIKGSIETMQQEIRSLYSFDNLSLKKREAYTHILSRVKPVLSSCEADETRVIRQIEILLEQPVNILSHGQKSTDVQILRPLI